MKHLIYLLIILVSNISFYSFGQQIDTAQLQAGTEISSIDLSKLSPEQLAEYQLMLDLNESITEENNKSYFTKIRNEYRQLETQAAALAKKRGVLKSSAIHLAPTKLQFHVIDGAIIFTTLMKQHNANPLAMVHHLENTFDPTAWISFYAFSVSQGFYMDFKTKGMSPAMKAKAMSGLIYRGMVYGSLASNITADTINLFKDCVFARLSNKDPKEIDSKCGSTLQQWTIRKKANQYGSQIVGLVAGQILSDVVAGLSKKGFDNKLTKKALAASEKIALKATNKFLSLKKASLVIEFSPLGFEAKGLKYALTFLNYVNFLAGGKIIEPFTNRLGGNLTHRLTTAPLMATVEESLSDASVSQWNFDQIDELPKATQEKLNELPEKIVEMTDLLNDYRMHLNSENETALEEWNTTNKQLIHQMKYIKDFYSNFNEILGKKYIAHRQNNFPDISLPLFGVKTEFDKDNRKDANEYLLRPDQLTKAQSKRLNDIAKKYGPYVESLKQTNSADYSYLKEFLIGLASDKIEIQAKKLVEMNKYLNRYIENKKDFTTFRPFGAYTEKFLKNLAVEIGNPYPIINNNALSYSYAYAVNDTYLEIEKAAQFPINSSSMYFHNSPALLMYHMLCGPKMPQIVESPLTGFYFKFPSIVKQNTQLEICQVYNGNADYLRKYNLNTFSTSNLFDAKINNQPFFNYITDPNNLMPEYFTIEGVDQYTDWWAKSEFTFFQQMKKFDDRKAYWIDGTYDQFIGAKSAVQYLTDIYSNPNEDDKVQNVNVGKLSSKYLPTNLQDSLLSELKIYSKAYASYLAQQNNKYTPLETNFVQKLRHEFNSQSDKASLFPEIQQANYKISDLKKALNAFDIPKDFIDMINVARKKKAEENKDAANNENQNNEQSNMEDLKPYADQNDYKKTHASYQELYSAYYLLKQYYESRINKVEGLKSMIEESLLIQDINETLNTVVRTNLNNVKNQKLILKESVAELSKFKFEEDFLKAMGQKNQSIYLNSIDTFQKLSLLVNSRLGYLRIKLSKDKQNKLLTDQYKFVSDSLSQLQSHSFALLEKEILAMFSLFRQPEVTNDQINKIKSQIETYMNLNFGSSEVIQLYDPRSKDPNLTLDQKFKFSIFNGVQSIAQTAQRFASFRVKAPALYQMSLEETKSFYHHNDSVQKHAKKNGAYYSGE